MALCRWGVGFGKRWPEAKLKGLARATPQPAPERGPSPKKTKAPRQPAAPLTEEESERQLQTKCHAAFTTWAPSLCWVLPDGRQAGLGWMNKNDGKKNIVAAGLDKAQGLTPGVPDWQLAYGAHGHLGLFVEFKTLRGSTSPAQDEMHRQLKARGYFVAIVRTLPEFCKLLRWYLGAAIFKLNI